MATKQYRVSDEQHGEIAAASAAEQIVKILMQLSKEPRSPIVVRQQARAWGDLQNLAGSRYNAASSDGAPVTVDPAPVKRSRRKYTDKAPEAETANGPVQQSLPRDIAS